MRAFIAIELPIEIKDALSKIQEKLKAPLPKVIWGKPQKLHFTLKFLGNITPEQLYTIKQITAEITKAAAGFKIKLGHLGVLPDWQAARIICIGANQPPLELKQLAEQLEIRLAESSLPLEERPFYAHITIGRIKTQLIPSDLRKSLDKVENDLSCANWEFDCREIVLFESALGPGGPTYTALEKFKLRMI
jgi:RNA 2',3'-cyclic 3'-phosphodiesterase